MDESLDVAASVTTRFTWDYVQERVPLTKLYEKGKRSQWNATDDIDWSPAVDFGSPLEQNPLDAFGTGFAEQMGGTWARLEDSTRNQLRWEFQSWMVSQFMHGEQGALVATARLVETVPDIESKYYAANQVNDEARHVEAYARYLNDKLKDSYPISRPLEALLTDIMGESRWDLTYLGMQIMVEGLALAAFGLGNVVFHDPVIKQITDYVMRDEARHVAFGVLALKDIVPQMSSSELAEREEFLLEASQLMYDRFLLEQVWERIGIPVEEGKAFAANNPLMVVFRQQLFSKIVPNLKKLGLLSPRLRSLYESLDVIHHENAPDASLGEVEAAEA